MRRPLTAASTRRRIVLTTCGMVLGGCGASWHPYTAGDTDCLNTNMVYFHSTWSQSLAACGTRVPDLTGDAELQRLARYDHVRFWIDPDRDRALKLTDHSHRTDDAPYDQYSAVIPGAPWD